MSGGYSFYARFGLGQGWLPIIPRICRNAGALPGPLTETKLTRLSR
jgi:hypothetical protein